MCRLNASSSLVVCLKVSRKKTLRRGYLARDTHRTRSKYGTAAFQERDDCRHWAPALDRGLAVLEALDMRPEGMSLSEISLISSKEGWHRHHQRPKSEAG